MGWIFQSSKMGVMDVPDGFRRALRFLSLWEFLVKTLGLEEKGRYYDGVQGGVYEYFSMGQWADET